MDSSLFPIDFIDRLACLALPIFSLLMISLQHVVELFFDQISLDRVLSRQDRSLRAVRVIKHPEHDTRQRVRGRRVVGRRHHLGEIVLKGLAKDGIEGQVRPHDVLLHPHLTAEALDLLPQAVEILKEGKACVKRCLTVNGSPFVSPPPAGGVCPSGKLSRIRDGSSPFS